MQIEIGLPDEPGRLQILKIKTSSAKENAFLDRSVDLASLAARTKNYSGAELEGLMKSATSFALNRQVDPTNLQKVIDEEAIKVTMEDFENALTEVLPAFGASTHLLERCRLNGMTSTGLAATLALESGFPFIKMVRCDAPPIQPSRSPSFQTMTMIKIQK